MSETFHTSDQHWFHEPILELGEGRPFESIEHQTEVLVKRHNEVVRAQDTTWFHGDFALGNRRAALRHVKRLNGRRLLLMGNHDSCFVGQTNGWRNIAMYVEAGFEVVLPWAKVKLPPLSPERPGLKVMLSHFPYDGDHVQADGKDRHVQARLRDEGTPLVHGHVHHEYTLAYSEKTGVPMVNVGVDVWDYRPVRATDIARLMAEAIELGPEGRPPF